MRRPFKPNGCSGGIRFFYTRILGKKHSPFKDCCDDHDYFYYETGDRYDRKYADRLLKTCIERDGYPIMAWIMYIGVRLFGWIWWNKSKLEHHRYEQNKKK